jgi:large subunit ribosomal protein L31e
MAKKETTPSSKKIEREYVIPLRGQVLKVPRYKKANKATKTIKEFLAKHMKVPDRDLSKIKLDLQINEIVWQRGIKKPIHKIKVKAIKDEDGIVRASAVNVPDKIKFRHSKIEKRESKAKEALESKKTMMQKAKEGMKGTEKESQKESPNQPGQDKDKDGVDDKVEEKEKAKSEEVANKELEKQMAKQAKHTTKPKSGKEKVANIKSQDRTSRGH